MSDALTSSETPTGKTRFLLWVIRVTVACGELGLAYAWFSGLASPAELVSMHLATVAMFFGAVWLTDRKAFGGLLVVGMMLLLTGPLAAAGMILRRHRGSTVLSVARTVAAPVSSAELLYSDIIAGRRPRRDPCNQLSLLDRLSSCDLATQQFAVAAISRSYRSEMHPALMAALQSQTPAVRVQAAAVFAKLREQYASEARQLLELLDSNVSDVEALPRRSQIMAACRELARSPFLDHTITGALTKKARHLEAEMAPAVSAAPSVSAKAEPVMQDNPARKMAPISGKHVTAVKARAVAASSIERLFPSPSDGLERIA